MTYIIHSCIITYIIYALAEVFTSFDGGPVVERSLPHPIRSRERECIYYICYYAMNDRSISSPQFKRLVDEPRSRRGLRFLVQGLVLACWLNPRMRKQARP